MSSASWRSDRFACLRRSRMNAPRASRCASHASRYDLTTGEAVGPFACGAIPVYACRIEDDAIFVDIDEQLNDAPVPRHPAPGSRGSN